MVIWDVAHLARKPLGKVLGFSTAGISDELHPFTKSSEARLVQPTHLPVLVGSAPHFQTTKFMNNTYEIYSLYGLKHPSWKTNNKVIDVFKQRDIYDCEKAHSKLKILWRSFIGEFVYHALVN